MITNAHQESPSLFNEAGNPWFRRWTVAGRSVVGYWMGWLVLIVVVMGILYLSQKAAQFSQRAQRASDKLDKIIEKWVRLLQTNFSSLSEQKARQRVADFLSQNFGNGPFEFNTAPGGMGMTNEQDVGEREPFLKHGHGNGYAADYDEDDLVTDCDGLLAVFASWAGRVATMKHARVHKLVRQDTDTEQVDMRGSYIRSTVGVDLVWEPVVVVVVPNQQRQRLYWSFEFSGLLRSLKSGDDWKLYNVKAYDWFDEK